MFLIRITLTILFLYPVFLQADRANTPPEFEINILQDKIDCAYGYEDDKANFTKEPIDEKGRTKDWLVLVNMHTDMPLNLTNEFNPQKRTLKWGLPYEGAYHNLFSLQDAHKNSALLRDWTSDGFREKVTFVIIPPLKKILSLQLVMLSLKQLKLMKTSQVMACKFG